MSKPKTTTGQSRAIRFSGDSDAVRRQDNAAVHKPSAQWPDGYGGPFVGPDDVTRPEQGISETREPLDE